MKVNNILKKVVLGTCAVLMLGSCNDFLTIYPTDKTVGKDFWKKKEDVDQMVTGAYSAMTSYNVIERSIVWGAFRSDELVKRTSLSNTTMDNVLAMNLLPTNSYNSWSSFYNVINRCNIVLNHAEGVMAEDPEFTQGDYETVRGQMLALRSLCYFYLVRAFRDVPYTTQSYEDDDQQMQVAQMCPDSVLNYCIQDLKEAETKVMRSGAYGSSNWRNQGYFTRDAVYALLADIYLWKASMNHSQEDYENCVVYADKLINSKDEYHRNNAYGSVGGADKDIYHLVDGRIAFSSIFGSNNSSESILEWQFDGDRNSNTALENYYDMSGSSSNHDASGMVEASQIFNSVNDDANQLSGTKVYASKNDLRFWNNVYLANSSEALQLEIRKYVDKTGSNISSPEGRNVGLEKSSNNFDNYQRNWIVYRLTDVMLMKAEAQVQLAASDSDAVLRQAFDLVQVVNKRSMTTNAKDTLTYSDFNSKASMEELVLAERERELCFEGKRWFDLVRYAYRHMDGVNSRQKMADVSSWPSLPRAFTRAIIRKYDTGGDAVAYKMKSEPFLYWPILRSEVHVNRLLKQNPVYSDNQTSSKN
ncbi:MAG TPA: RagB/SusD family nutrient uptake outer membrane protein [Prevotella sp.]|nr:RagB/SusD family nutrient uptake outer membrane protein [Prevotella sp.]